VNAPTGLRTTAEIEFTDAHGNCVYLLLLRTAQSGGDHPPTDAEGLRDGTATRRWRKDEDVVIRETLKLQTHHFLLTFRPALATYLLFLTARGLQPALGLAD